MIKNKEYKKEDSRELIKIETYGFDEPALTPEQKRVKHIVASLYKIKAIDRKEIYSIDELRKTVLSHKIGKKVLKKLKEESINGLWLLQNNQTLLYNVFAKKLREPRNLKL